MGTKPAIKLTGQTLLDWRSVMGFNQRDACKALGCSRGAWGGWESGAQPVPRYIGLAMAALALNMTEYGSVPGPKSPA